MGAYAQARFSSFPNVTWSVSNDKYMKSQITGSTYYTQTMGNAVSKIATDMKKREPWGTLLTNHQARYTGYDFTTATWSDVVTIESLDDIVVPYLSHTDT